MMQAVELIAPDFAMKALSPKQASFFFNLAKRIVPAVGELGRRKRESFCKAVDGILMNRAASVRLQFKVFLFILRWSPIFRYANALDRLSPKVQDHFLTAVQNGPIHLLRAGFWGLKTLVFVGYYGGLDLGHQIYYTPSSNGNEKLHA